MPSYEEDLQVLNEIRMGNAEEQRKSIIKTFPLDKFPGRFPVRTLIHNVMTKYNASSRSATADLKRLTESGQLNTVLRYTFNDSHLIGPYVSETDGFYSISLSETFVAYSWCLTYFFLLNYEYLLQKVRRIEDDFTITPKMIERSKELFSWAKNLKNDAMVSWPRSFPDPNPTSDLEGSEACYCLKVNGLLSCVISFCLFHELGHALHRDKEDGGSSSVEMEQAADNYALECLLGNTEDSRRIETGLAAIIGFGELLFIPDQLYGLKTEDHPESHRRVANARQRIRDYYGGFFSKEFDTMMIVIYSSLFNLHGKEVEGTPFESLKDAIQFFEDEIDNTINKAKGNDRSRKTLP